MNILHILLLIFLSFNLLFAKQSDADNIAKMIKQQLFELDKESMESTILPYLKEKPDIHKVEIKDTITNENFLNLINENNNLHTVDKILKKCPSYHIEFTAPVVYDNEKIGEVVVCNSTFMTSLKLTEKELEWLRKHPVIKVHNELNWAPMNFNKGGIPTGFSIELMNLLAKKIGIKVEYVSGEWNELYQKAINKKIDVMLNIAKTEEREKFFLFTAPYKDNKGGIFALKSSKSINSLESLYGKKLAIIKGFYLEDLLKEDYPLIEVIGVKNLQEALELVNNKKADATISSYVTANYLIQKNMYYEIEDKGAFKEKEESFLHLGVRKDYPELYSILQKAMADVGTNEINKIRKKWLHSYLNLSLIRFTEAEKEWLKKHPTIKVHNEQDWPPFNYNENGKPSGYSIDLMNIVAKNLGIKVEYITGPTWDQFLQMMKNGTLDVMLNIVQTEQRDKYLNFTNPFIQAMHAVAVRSDNTKITSFEDIVKNKKTIAVVKGFFYHEYINKHHPEVKLKFVDSALQALQEVSYGNADATVGMFPVMNYIIQKNFITNLKIFGNKDKLPFKPVPLRFATGKGNPELLSILKKGMESVTREQYKELSSKWLTSAKVIKRELNFTKEEKKWLENNPLVKIAVMDFWKSDDNGNNIHTDFIKLINKYGNLNLISVKYDTWKNGFNEASLGENIHGIMNLSWSKEREEKYFDYIKGYYFVPHYLVVKKDNESIKTLDDLNGKKVYVKKKSITKIRLENYSSKIKIYELKSDIELVELLSSTKNADAIVVSHIEPEVFEKHGLKIVKMINDKYNESYLGINQKYKELGSILDKVVKVIPKEELRKIQNHKYEKKISKIKLTKKEQEWLDKKTLIKYVYDPDWAPFEWKNELDEHTGIVYDLLSLISQRTGIEFKQVDVNKWSEAVKLAESNEVDMYSGVGENEKRKSYMNFTKNSIYSTPYVFVVHKNDQRDYFETFKVIPKDIKIAVVKGYTIHGLLQENEPGLKLTTVSSTLEGFKKLEDKKIDIFIVNAATAKYFINRKGFDGVKIATKTKYNLDLKIALNKSFPEEVISILDKGIESIGDKELSDIYFKWTEILVEEKIDWTFVLQIVGVGLIIIIFVVYNNRRLARLVDKKTKDIQDQKIELENLIEKFDNNVIFSRTDLKGIITHASDAFCEISGYSYDELVGKPHNIVRHPDMPKELFTSLWKNLKEKKPICLEIKNKKKNGDFYWVESCFEPDYDKDGNHIGYSAIRVEITNKKAVEELSRSLEEKVIERTSELNNERKYITSIMNAQENLVITTDGVQICNANHSFFHFFQVTKIEEFIEKYGNCICDTFDTDNPEEYIQKLHKGKKWVDYIYETPGEIHEVKITVLGKTQIFSVSVDKFFHNEQALDVAVFTNITELEEMRKENEKIHERTKESIEYASLIQHSLITEEKSFEKHFSEYMTIWQPKDVVGGDIYLFDELRNENESLLMVIDCTGHGVHGAFVTMMVRAIERQIVSKITYDHTIEVSPAWILSYFNTQMKKLLKQESSDSISNAGFDGVIFYFNQKENYIKYAGANIPLFYTHNGEVKKVKCDRHSIGYKQSDSNFEFHDHRIDVENGMVFYMTSDGYLDQNGGDKGFPFGKKRLLSILEEHQDKSLSEQKEILIKSLKEYQGEEDRNDDITFVALRI